MLLGCGNAVHDMVEVIFEVEIALLAVMVIDVGRLVPLEVLQAVEELVAPWKCATKFLLRA
jgi:hypothetical protein